MKRCLILVLAACGGAPVTPTVPRDADVDARAAAMLDAFVNTAPVLVGDHVVFLSNRDGLPQLYVGERAHPEHAPARLPTPAGERVVGPGSPPTASTCSSRTRAKA